MPITHYNQRYPPNNGDVAWSCFFLVLNDRLHLHFVVSKDKWYVLEQCNFFERRYLLSCSRYLKLHFKFKFLMVSIELLMLHQNNYFWWQSCCSWLGRFLKITTKYLFSLPGMVSCPLLAFREHHNFSNIL